MIAAVYEVEAPAVARLLRCVAGVDDEEGVAAVGRAAGAGFHRVLPGGQRNGVLAHLARPRAAEARDGQIRARQIELRGQKPLNVHGCLGAVAQDGLAADAVAVGPDVVMRLQRQAGVAVAVGHAQVLGLAVLGIAARQGRLRRLGVVDGVGFVEEIARAAAVGVHKLQHRLAQIALAQRGELQTDVLQRQLRVMRVIAQRIARWERAPFRDGRKRRLAVQRQLASVVELLRLKRRQHAEAVGRARGLQHEGRALGSKCAYHVASSSFFLRST